MELHVSDELVSEEFVSEETKLLDIEINYDFAAFSLASIVLSVFSFGEVLTPEKFGSLNSLFVCFLQTVLIFNYDLFENNPFQI